MLKILFISLISLLLAVLFLKGRLNTPNNEKPIFLKTDKIALAHTTDISFTVQSFYKPDPAQLQLLKNDYNNIWAHLNNVYQTNDIEIGKEYYTEAWFKQLALHYIGAVKPSLKRTDESHDLYIKNWSSDGLVCTLIDSNVIFKTILPNKSTIQTKNNLAIVLLFQGDHWRIDAMRVLP